VDGCTIIVTILPINLRYVGDNPNLCDFTIVKTGHQFTVMMLPFDTDPLVATALFIITILATLTVIMIFFSLYRARRAVHHIVYCIVTGSPDFSCHADFAHTLEWSSLLHEPGVPSCNVRAFLPRSQQKPPPDCWLWTPLAGAPVSAPLPAPEILPAALDRRCVGSGGRDARNVCAPVEEAAWL
jgi:hypothetical protein